MHEADALLAGASPDAPARPGGRGPAAPPLGPHVAVGSARCASPPGWARTPVSNTGVTSNGLPIRDLVPVGRGPS